MQHDFPIIFKENMALQLEATYRKNVEKAHSELKRRLDYLKEVNTLICDVFIDYFLGWRY